MLEKSGLPWQRRSQIQAKSPPANLPTRILLVDVVGELGAWWGLATCGFVGGSLGRRGGQNMIEPAAYGVATSFGPNTWNFRDIVSQLLQHQAAVVVHDESELSDFVRRCADSPEFLGELGGARPAAGDRSARSHTTYGAAAAAIDFPPTQGRPGPDTICFVSLFHRSEGAWLPNLVRTTYNVRFVKRACCRKQYRATLGTQHRFATCRGSRRHSIW